MILLSSVSVSAQTKTVAAVKQIETYAKSIDKLTTQRKEPDIVIADVSDYDTAKPEWRRFRSAKDLEDFRDETETYSIAYLWRTNGKIVSAVFTVFSPSGDWAEYITHYFRPDGSAAKVTTELRTFYGDYLVIRERFFNSRGKLLKQTSKFLDLTTKKPKKPTKEFADENSGFRRADFYKKVSALPFYSLTASK